MRVFSSRICYAVCYAERSGHGIAKTAMRRAAAYLGIASVGSVEKGCNNSSFCYAKSDGIVRHSNPEMVSADVLCGDMPPIGRHSGIARHTRIESEKRKTIFTHGQRECWGEVANPLLRIAFKHAIFSRAQVIDR